MDDLTMAFAHVCQAFSEQIVLKVARHVTLSEVRLRWERKKNFDSNAPPPFYLVTDNSNKQKAFAKTVEMAAAAFATLVNYFFSASRLFFNNTETFLLDSHSNTTNQQTMTRF